VPTDSDQTSLAGPAAIAAGARESARTLRACVAALRPHQWAKNVLVFLPVVAGHRLTEGAALGSAALAFAAFSLTASAVYVLNDLVDLEHDRAHVTKRQRPFASGTLGVRTGMALVPALLLVAAALTAALPPAFGLLLAGYFGANLAYSFFLKRRVIADVVLLAGLYTARIFAGGLATGIEVSEWLASFSGFLFLSLALVKRASELVRAGADLPGRDYRLVDREAVLSMGTASGYLSVLVLAMYVTHADVRLLYAHPAWLWALCPLVLYWVSRLWVRARRGEVEGDPVVFALADPATYLVGALAAVSLYLGS
jgi:4-hydroxybenzoate polyprenyltransferase